MFWLILLSLILAAFVLSVLDKSNKYPSKKHKKLATNLWVEESQSEVDYQKQIRKEKIGKIVRYIVAYTLLSIAAFFIIFPFYWMFATSVKTAEETILYPPTIIPNEVHFSNFRRAMTQAPFGTYMINTLIVGIFSTLGTLVTTVLSAYAFARLNFKGKDLLFSIFIATMMIPGEILVITNYVTVCSENILNWYNTYEAMIVPFWVSTYYIFLLRNTFKQIPNELYYAAKVDGTSDFKYLLKVMLPIASPTIITITILKLMGAWNSYIWPNLVTDASLGKDLTLITVGLRKSFATEENGLPLTNLQMAATTVVTVPLLLVFIFFRKYIIRGVSRSGIKG